MKHTLLKTSFIACAFLATAVQAQTPEEKGLAIAVEADKRGTGYGDSSVEMTMTLRNKQGQEATRAIRSRALEMSDDGDRSMLIFDEPKDVEGTALLTWSHKKEDDDQWLYLPALKRVKRIASSNKSGPFVGSEFAYEDLSSQEVEKYTYKWIRDETYDGQEVFVFERYPADKNSGYTRNLVWMDKAEYRPLKIEFYDRKKSLLKTLELKEYKEYLGQYWRPHRLDMVNHQTGKSTTLTFGEYTFKEGFVERDFDQNSLKAIR